MDLLYALGLLVLFFAPELLALIFGVDYPGRPYQPPSILHGDEARDEQPGELWPLERKRK